MVDVETDKQAPQAVRTHVISQVQHSLQQCVPSFTVMPAFAVRMKTKMAPRWRHVCVDCCHRMTAESLLDPNIDPIELVRAAAAADATVDESVESGEDESQ